MRLDKLAVTAQEAFQASMGVAGDAQSSTIEPIHLLKAMLDASENNLSAIIKRIGADPAQLSRNVDDAIAAMPKASGSSMPMAMPSNNLIKVIDNAVKAAERMGDSYATTEHLLIALAQDKGEAGRVLNGLGITGKTVEEAYSSLRGSTRVTDQQSKPELDALNQYGQNLTQKAREGKLDPVIGRSEEIRRTIQVLSRRTKNNPVLIGEPGVGKTAIVEGLAQRIVAGDVPSGLKDHDVIALDLGAMVAGAKYRGEFEDRLKAVLREVRNRTGRSFCSSTSFIPSWAQALRATAPWTRVTCSSRRLRVVNCTPSALPRSTSTASTSRRTPPLSAVSRRSWSASPRSRTPSPFCVA